MKYRILPGEGTPYWLFGILFALLVINILLSFVGKHRLKLWFLVAVLLISLGGPMVTAIVDRARTAPVYGVHDIILQQEAAMRKLIEGKNPYKETYFDTPLAAFNYDEPGNTEAVNPALFHFVMPPWYLLFPFAFYFTAIPLFGFFDSRMALLFAMAMLLIAVWHWFRDKKIAHIAMILTALSPAVVDYVIEGRSDVFALSWLMVSLVLFAKGKFVRSGILLALAVLSKQTIWFVLPFFAVYAWKNMRKIVLGFVPVILALTVPFLVWDWRAFFDSVVFYLSGNASQSYPVSGYGLGMLLYQWGVIRDIHAYYPFIIWQLVVAGPVFIILWKWLAKHPSESRLMISYAVFLAVYWYLSRYFNNSHVGYLSMLFVLGGLKYVDESHT